LESSILNLFTISLVYLAWCTNVPSFDCCWGIQENLSPSKRRVLRNSWNKFLGILSLRRSGILNQRSSKIGNLRRSEAVDLRSSVVANLWRSRILDLRSPWGREPVKTRSHELAKPRNEESTKFWNLLKFEFESRGVWRFLELGDSRISRKPNQRHRLKKSGFGVWTSGSLVNVWDVKDIHVRIRTRNIPWVRGCFQNVKVPSSPY
jgi:hypothetical protein